MAAQVLSAFTATQPGGTTYKVNFGLTVADADTDYLTLAYNWKKQSDSTYTPATTTAPTSVTATPGGVAVNGVWDLDADFTGNQLAVPLTIQVVSTKPAVAATGSVTTVAANATTGVKGGDTLTIGGRVYEFTSGAAITAGHVAVVLSSATDTATQVKNALILAVNNDNAAVITASSGAGNVVNFIADVAGAAGNGAIVQSVANAITFTPVGMLNGADPQVVSATANVTANTGNGVAAPSVVVVVDKKHDYSKKVIEGRSDEYGAIAQGNFFGSYAKKVLNTVASGTRLFARIYGDRNLRNERAVLVNPAYLAANQGSAVFTVVEKPVAWLTDIAGRTLSDERVFQGNVIYAIVSRSVKQPKNVTALVQQHTPVLAYLLSAVEFESTIN